MKKKSKKMEMEECCGGLNKSQKRSNTPCGGPFYMLGVIGAAIYYLSTAAGFWAGVLGVLKAIVWPVFLVYELLGFVGA